MANRFALFQFCKNLVPLPKRRVESATANHRQQVQYIPLLAAPEFPANFSLLGLQEDLQQCQILQAVKDDFRNVSKFTRPYMLPDSAPSEVPPWWFILWMGGCVLTLILDVLASGSARQWGLLRSLETVRQRAAETMRRIKLRRANRTARVHP